MSSGKDKNIKSACRWKPSEFLIRWRNPRWEGLISPLWAPECCLRRWKRREKERKRDKCSKRSVGRALRTVANKIQHQTQTYNHCGHDWDRNRPEPIFSQNFHWWKPFCCNSKHQIRVWLQPICWKHPTSHPRWLQMTGAVTGMPNTRTLKILESFAFWHSKSFVDLHGEEKN